MAPLIVFNLEKLAGHEKDAKQLDVHGKIKNTAIR